MNIKGKLIQQISFLEKAQAMAFASNDTSTATCISTLILDYIKQLDDYEIEDECCCPNDDNICPNCEVEFKHMLHEDISDACGMPIEVVNRVLAGQDEVFSRLD